MKKISPDEEEEDLKRPRDRLRSPVWRQVSTELEKEIGWGEQTNKKKQPAKKHSKCARQWRGQSCGQSYFLSWDWYLSQVVVHGSESRSHGLGLNPDHRVGHGVSLGVGLLIPWSVMGLVSTEPRGKIIVDQLMMMITFIIITIIMHWLDHLQRELTLLDSSWTVFLATLSCRIQVTSVKKWRFNKFMWSDQSITMRNLPPSVASLPSSTFESVSPVFKCCSFSGESCHWM